MALQLGWIGLGNMGRGMVKNLVEKGNLSRPLIIFNRSKNRAEEIATKLGPEKVKVAETIKDVITPSDIIFTCVGDDAAIKATMESALQSDVKGKLFVDCSTVHPETTNSIGKLVTDKGGEFVACPVFGAAAAAEAGQLVCVLAGPASCVEKVKPYAAGVMGRANIDFSGEEYGKASLLKVIGNTFVLNLAEALGEAHTLAEKSGLGSDNLHHFIETLFPGPYIMYSKRIMSGEYYKREEPLFGVDLARKDARHALDLGRSCGTKLKAVEVAEGHLAQVQEHMGSKGDIAGIYGAVRQESGLRFEN